MLAIKLNANLFYPLRDWVTTTAGPNGAVGCGQGPFNQLIAFIGTGDRVLSQYVRIA